MAPYKQEAIISANDDLAHLCKRRMIKRKLKIVVTYFHLRSKYLIHKTYTVGFTNSYVLLTIYDLIIPTCDFVISYVGLTHT